MPVGDTAGPALNNAGLVLPVTRNVSVCVDSSAGPAIIAVAQFVTDRAPLSSSDVGFGPPVKLGASLTASRVIVVNTAALGVMPSVAIKMTRRSPVAGVPEVFW